MKYNITISKEQLLDTSHDDSGYDIAAGIPALAERANLVKLNLEGFSEESTARRHPGDRPCRSGPKSGEWPM